MIIFFFLAVPAQCAGLPWPGMEPMAPVVEGWSLNHWTIREVPFSQLLSDPPWDKNYNNTQAWAMFLPQLEAGAVRYINRKRLWG